MEEQSLTRANQNLSSGFRFDTSNIEWKKFVTDGTWYKLLHVDVPGRTADMVVKFEPGARCLYHRHAATTITFVLEGELHVMEQTPEGEKTRVKHAGDFSAGAKGEIHIEGGGEDGTVVYFSMRGDTDQIYDLLNTDFSLRKAISIQDFAKDLEFWTNPESRPTKVA